MSEAAGEIALLELVTAGSTNDEAWREGRAAFAARGARALAVRADEQTGGRGRQGRTWLSPRGGGLYLSVWLRLDWPPARARLLTLAAGLALREACRVTSGLAPDTKWPNDLLAPGPGGGKLAGVLTETRMEGGRVSEAVVGMGLNLRAPGPIPGPAPGDGPPPVGLASLVPGHRVPTAGALARAAAHALASEVGALSEGGEPAAADVLERFRSACAMWGRPVRFVQGDRALIGEARDVAEDGGLLVRLPSGVTTVLHAGDVHLLPVGG